jgi:hypothetical protein
MISLKIWYLHLANYLKATTYFYLFLLKVELVKKFLSQLKSTKLICLICYPTSIYSYPISIYNFRAAINIFVKQKLSSVSLFKKREMCSINSYLACSSSMSITVGEFQHWGYKIRWTFA